MTTASTATVFRDIRPHSRAAPVELIAAGGLLVERVPEGARVEVVEGGGRIALPTLVDAHIHPDKTAWGEPWYSRRPASGLPEYVRGDVELYERQRTPLAERAERLADAGIGLTTVAPSAHQVLPFRELAAHGVQVGLGSDGVRDSWSPFGNADMLHRAHLLGWTTDARTDTQLAECFALASAGGAELLGLPAADLTPGSPADFMLVTGECLPQVVVDLPERELVVRAGRVVARNGRFLG
ncbi:amidohydrolase family protein [Kitasatospora sp. NPDC091207]|uniref:amidohydrolase family protein n=1 Tax=Kitasatospora sp. NPDC091207 TaxID=3364083 RepID=UPI0037F2B221